MLIECNECGKQISDKAEACPNCGCPVKLSNNENFCNINGTQYDLSDFINILPRIGEGFNDVDPGYLLGMLRDRTPLDITSREKLVDIIMQTKKIPKEFNGTIDYVRLQLQANPSPKCPTCQSKDIQKIGTLERATSVATLGLFSKKINKSFKCNNCKYTW